MGHDYTWNITSRDDSSTPVIGRHIELIVLTMTDPWSLQSTEYMHHFLHRDKLLSCLLVN